jgi:WD40 repeat protein
MSNIFISYDRSDEKFASELKRALEKLGYKTWIDTEKLQPSVLWSEDIGKAIKQSVAFIYLISQESIRDGSYCRVEFNDAEILGKKIIPILLPSIADYRELPKEVTKYHFFKWNAFGEFPIDISSLQRIIQTNFRWAEFHTRLTEQSDNWKKERKRQIEHPLSKKEILEAKSIFSTITSDELPKPTQIIKDYVLANEKRLTLQGKIITSISFIVLMTICATVIIAIYQSYVARQATASVAPLQEAKIAAEATAQAEQDRADQEARIAHAGQLADQAESIRGQSPIVSFLLSIEAFNLFDNFQTRSTLMNSKAAYPQILRFISNPNVSKSNKAYISASAFSKNGKIIAFAIDDTIVLQDVESGKELQVFTLPPRNADGDRNYVYRLEFSPDSKILASDSAEGEVILWGIDSGLISRKLTGHEEGALVKDLSFSSNGQMLASSSQNDDMLIVWDVFTGQQLCNIKTYSESLSLFFIPQTNKFVTRIYVSIPPNSQFESDVENNILIWDASTCTSSVLTFDQQIGRIFGVTVSQNGKIFALETNSLIGSEKVYRDGKTVTLETYNTDVTLWDVSTNQPIFRFSGQNRAHVNTIALSPNGNTLAVGYETGDIELWDIKTGKTLKTFNSGSGRISNLLFNPDGNILLSVSGNDEFAILWNLAQKESVNILTGLTYQVNSVAFNSNGSILAAGNNGTSIMLWNPVTGQQICDLEGHTKNIIDVAFEPNGVLISTDISGEETLTWDPYTCKQIPNDNGRKFPYDPNYHAFSPDGQISADVKDQYTIILVDTGTSQPIGEPLIYNASSIFGIAFSPDGKILAAGCDDGTIVLWDVATSKMLGRFTGHNGTVYSLAFSPDGKVLASGSGDGTVRLWEIDPQTWLQEVCQTAGRNLTKDEWNRYFPNENYRITCSQWQSGE